jgi:hypothetical protein
MENGEVLGFIKGVGIGMRDTSGACLWFTAYTDEHSASLQILNWKEAKKLIEDAQVHNVNDLNRRACIIDVSKLGVHRFVRIAKLV